MPGVADAGDGGQRVEAALRGGPGVERARELFADDEDKPLLAGLTGGRTDGRTSPPRAEPEDKGAHCRCSSRKARRMTDSTNRDRKFAHAFFNRADIQPEDG